MTAPPSTEGEASGGRSSARDPALRRWEAAGAVALAVMVAVVPLSLLRSRRNVAGDSGAEPSAAFVGTAACVDCHPVEYEKWHGSDHDRAMEEASEETVLGDFGDVEVTFFGITSRFYRRDGKFLVWTEGPAGGMGEFEIAYTFGFEPLQQYLVRFPQGRLQALSLAWDVERKRWFHLYPEERIAPDDWLHWTRNGQNWNGMCAECHSTNLKKGYDPDTETYQTTWSDIDVGCEACHGPASRHVEWAEMPPMARPELPAAGLVVPTRDIGSVELVELCAPCHSRRAELGDYDHSGRPLLDHMLPSLLREGLYYPDGQILDEVYVYGSFVQSKMYARGVRCSDCHDSHRLGLLREGNELCLQCHERDVYDAESHHFHRKTDADGRPSDGARCVKCHMVERPYMVIDWRADHSFRVPRPDLTADIGTPNACTQGGCHDDRPLTWSLDAYRRWYGQARRPHFGTTFAAGRAGRPEAREDLARLAANTLQPALVRATALELLAGYPGAAADEVTTAALVADEALLRQTAVSQIRITGPARRAELLGPLLSDPIEAVRLAALPRLAGVPKEQLPTYRREAFEAALEEYREAMSHSLDFAASGMNLGNLYADLGQPSTAEHYYRLALKIDDLFYPAKLNLAVLMSAQGRNPEAEQLLREVLEAYPDNFEAAYSLGLLSVEMGRPQEALGLLQRAAESNPGHPRARYNFGLLLQQLGRPDEAETQLRAALELEPSSYDFLFALADHYLRRGRLELALPLTERMIAVDPEQPIGHQLKRMIEQGG